MFVALSAPADHAHGPQYLAPALAAVHQAFRGRQPWELLFAQHHAHVGLLFRATPTLVPIVVGQILAAFPDVRAEQVAGDSFDHRGNSHCYWARLRLAPGIAPLIGTEEFVDREERRLADPIAALLTVIASGRGEAVRPRVSLAVRPVGYVWAWWLRRRNRRGAAATKLAGPLWVVDVRLAVQAPHNRKAAALAKLHELAGVFAQYLPTGASRWRLSRVHSGRLPNRFRYWGLTYLTSAELGLLWHPPTASVRTPHMKFNESRALEPPPPGVLPTLARQSHLAVLGRTAFRERSETFGILPEDQFRHTYVVGQTGTGKTTLLTNLIAADVAAGRSVVVLDPHGDMIERLLDAVPPQRTNDVILFDPADGIQAVAYNPLACRTPAQRALTASAVVTSFKRLFGDSWGPRLEHILRNCVLTLLDNPGTTLVSLHRLLVDDPFRKQLVGHVSDEMVRAFWQSEWAHWTPQFRAEALSPVLNKVGAFTANPILRNVLGDPAAKLDLRDVLDSGRVLFCNLSKGRLGDDASTLLGSLLVAGVQLAAMSRADVPEHEPDRPCSSPMSSKTSSPAKLFLRCFPKCGSTALHSMRRINISSS